MRLNERENQRGFRRTTTFAAVIVLAVFGTLVARLYSLQVDQTDRWSSLSKNNRIRLQRIAPTRGLILDAQGEPLVENRPSYDVVVVPEDTEDLEATLRRITALLGRDPGAVDTLMKAARSRPAYDRLVVDRDVDYDTLVALETRQLELPGVSVEVGPMRTYPYGDLASHLLGYVGEVTASQLEDDPSYRMGDLVGRFGAERSWEDFLRGVAGGQQIEVDSVGRRLRVLSRVGETRGNSLVLTIDRRLQEFSEQLLEGKEGAIVVMRPGTGEILAMASEPGFDPNPFARGIRSDEWKALSSAEFNPLSNRALQGQYPPGSVFKIVTAAAALEEGVITPFSRIDCGGSYQFGDRAYRCWKAGGHGPMDLHDALVHSCDVYFYQVGKQLGVDTIAEYAHRLGLGEPTGIELDNEKPGLIPTSEWKKRRFGEPWYSGETLSVAIGQGYVLTTPLQMASVVATIANGGIRYRPQYIRHIESPSGEIVRTNEPEVVGETGLRRSTLHQIREALRDVVNGEGGTGSKAKLPTIDVAGKTGTAQVFKMGSKAIKTENLERRLRDHAWFVAFAPVEDPEIAISIIIEHSGRGGGAAAAPMAGAISDFYYGLTRGRDYPITDAPAPTDTVLPEEPETEIQLSRERPVRSPADVDVPEEPETEIQLSRERPVRSPADVGVPEETRARWRSILGRG